MTEEEARAWLAGQLDVSRETMERLDALRAAVIAENDRQNLVSAASIPEFWTRHIVDSAQLIGLAGPDAPMGGAWLDLGTGAGFPGMVIAILRKSPIMMVESRKLRVDFLERTRIALGLDHATIACTRVEQLATQPFAAISARAFAPLPRLLPLAHRFSTDGTVWLLPKGRIAREEVESIRAHWSGVFHVEPSVTDPESGVIVARNVRRKGRT